MKSTLRQTLQGASVVITVGSGGVGKTSIAAAIGLGAAMEGQRSLVLTIDPARRLADALGLEALGNTERQIPDAAFSKAGLMPRASMSAMMLDMKRSWDELIERGAPPGVRERILASRFYRSLSTELAGGQDYVAMEKLCALQDSHRDHLMVLDTPPSIHAVDFLESPNRLLDFLENESASWILKPASMAGRVGRRLFGLGGSVMNRALARLTGGDTLRQLVEFMANMSALNDNFRERAHATRAMLESPSTMFVMVVSAGLERLDDALRFLRVLKQHRLQVAAIVVNCFEPAPSAELFAQARALKGKLAKDVALTLEELQAESSIDAKGLEVLKREVPEYPVVVVPRLSSEVHNLSSLYAISQYL